MNARDALFKAGLLPSLLMIALLSLYSGWHARGLPRPPAPARGELWAAVKDAAWELPLPFVILIGIYAHVLAPSEAAAATALYVLIVTVLIRREITSRLYGWLAYTLSRSQILPNRGDPWRASQFDQPHILTIVAGYRPKPQWDLSTRFRFVSGNPYAPVDFATFDADSGNFVPTRGEVGDSREPPFLQLDARAQYTWTWDAWQLSLYLDVQNVTNHTNEEFHVYDYRFRDQGSISGLPILPTFGVKGKF